MDVDGALSEGKRRIAGKREQVRKLLMEHDREALAWLDDCRRVFGAGVKLEKLFIDGKEIR